MLGNVNRKKVRGSLLRLSGFAGQAGFSAPLAKKTASQIEEETKIMC